MSFGFAIGDFVALGKLAWGLYKQCKGASAEFAEVCNEILSIHTALRELEDEAQNEDSILNRAGKGRQKELNNIVENCTEVLHQLESLVTRYRSLGTSQKKVWDRIKFGDQGIQVIRNKLVLHTSTLTLFLTSLGTGSLGRIEKKLDDIAADIRAGNHEPSVMTAINDDEGSSQTEAWSFLSRELATDFSFQEIEAFKGEIKEYIRQLMENGALDEQRSPISSISSDEVPARLSTPQLCGQSSPIARSLNSSPQTADCSENWRPPTPTALEESETGVLDEEISISQTRNQNDREKTSSRVNLAETFVENGKQSVDVSENPSNRVTPIHLDASSPQLAEIRDRDGERRGDVSSIGIEIGVDHCRVAVYDSVQQKAVPIKDESGCIDIPTYIAFTQETILVGTAAKEQAVSNLENTFTGFTCFLDKASAGWTDAIADFKKWQCPTLRQRGQQLVIFVPCRRRHYTMIELTAVILRYCLQLARALSSPVPPPVCILASSTWTYHRLRALAQSAELAGIDSPTIISSATALAYKFAVQRRLWARQKRPQIVIVDLNSRGVGVIPVRLDHNAEGQNVITQSRTLFRHFGSSVDERNTWCWLPPEFKHDVKRAAIVTRNYRCDLIRHSMQDINASYLCGGEYSVALPPGPVLSSVDQVYSKEMKRQLQADWLTVQPGDICILVGESALLESVRDLVQQLIFEKAGSACSIVSPTLHETIHASVGALELVSQGIGIHDEFHHQLELLVSTQGNKSKYLVLLEEMQRGKRRGPWERTVSLAPSSIRQTGIYLAVAERRWFDTYILPRNLLFEAAVEPDVVSSLYDLAISIDFNFNLDFKLVGKELRGHPVHAEIYCASSGAIELRYGNFKGPTRSQQQNWLLRERPGKRK
jgi:Hsp70 protein